MVLAQRAGTPAGAVPELIKSHPALKSDACGQLNIPRPGTLRGLETRNLPETCNPHSETAGRSEIGVVKGVGNLRADSHAHSLRKVDALNERQRHRLRARANDVPGGGVPKPWKPSSGPAPPRRPPRCAWS